MALPKKDKIYFEGLYKKQILENASYIDARQRPLFKKWLNNRFKKHGVNAYLKSLKTNIMGNKIK